MAVGKSGSGERLEAYATLVRVPNLFSAPPDVLLGAALVTSTGATVSLPALVGLCFASVLLYAGGTVSNDYFDAPIDTTERPERPIPSGRVSRRAAGLLGGSLLVAGVALAFVAAGARAGAIAAGLAATIALYDGVLKSGPVGFLSMGTARGLNVLLGTAAAASAVALPTWALAVPAIVTLYIALVTYMAANEATDTPRGAVAAAAAGVVVAAAAVVGLVVTAGPPIVRGGLAVVLVAGFLAWTGHALEPAYADPRPGTVGPAVGACVLGLVVLDAAFAAVVGVGWALAVLAFLAPAVGLAQVFDVS